MSDNDAGTEPIDVDALLAAIGFDAETSALTRRQAEVLALRERGVAQATIAARLGTSRANVSSVEASARTNVEKARETVAFTDALQAPVGVRIEAGTDLYDVPSLVYNACDAAGLKVNHTAPELMTTVSEQAGEIVHGRQVRAALSIGVTANGAVRVRRSVRSD